MLCRSYWVGCIQPRSVASGADDGRRTTACEGEGYEWFGEKSLGVSGDSLVGKEENFEIEMEARGRGFRCVVDS